MGASLPDRPPAMFALLLALSPMPSPPSDPSFTAQGHTTDDPARVAAYVAGGTATLIDVRETDEWRDGHLAAATLVPLSELGEKANDPAWAADLKRRVPADRPVYTHCKSGGRCVLAAEPLRALGYDVRPMREGYKDLLAAGYERGGE